MGIIVVGLIDAGLFNGAILNSIDISPTVPNTEVDTSGEDVAEAARRRPWEKKCLEHYVACTETPVSNDPGNHWSQRRCGNCYDTCKVNHTWPTAVGNGSCEYWKRGWVNPPN